MITQMHKRKRRRNQNRSKFVQTLMRWNNRMRRKVLDKGYTGPRSSFYGMARLFDQIKYRLPDLFSTPAMLGRYVEPVRFIPGAQSHHYRPPSFDYGVRITPPDPLAPLKFIITKNQMPRIPDGFDVDENSVNEIAARLGKEKQDQTLQSLVKQFCRYNPEDML